MVGVSEGFLLNAQTVDRRQDCFAILNVLQICIEWPLIVIPIVLLKMDGEMMGFSVERQNMEEAQGFHGNSEMASQIQVCGEDAKQPMENTTANRMGLLFILNVRAVIMLLLAVSADQIMLTVPNMDLTMEQEYLVVRRSSLVILEECTVLQAKI